MKAAGFLVAVSLALAPATWAVEPGERLADPALEARAEAIERELRCVVCQNQSIGDSDADLARDLRVLVRERLTRGDTDAEATAYIVDRYGDFVLLRPPLKASTLALWLAPFGLAIAGAGAIALYLRGRRGAVDAPLTAEEQARAERLLGGQG